MRHFTDRAVHDRPLLQCSKLKLKETRLNTLAEMTLVKQRDALIASRLYATQLPRRLAPLSTAISETRSNTNLYHRTAVFAIFVNLRHFEPEWNRTESRGEIVIDSIFNGGRGR
jgi:hypothetical protein